MEYHKYYFNYLYPLQDKFLTFFGKYNKNRFYLTGGAALSRFYYQHRYSEDLDLFSVTELKDFREILTKVFNAVKRETFSIEIETISDHFYCIKNSEYGILSL